MTSHSGMLDSLESGESIAIETAESACGSHQYDQDTLSVITTVGNLVPLDVLLTSLGS